MEFVPLARRWGQHGDLSVFVTLLEDAGFHPVVECDPRGWMHYYSWPFGSSRPVLVWIPCSELEESLAFLQAPVEAQRFEPVQAPPSFWGLMHTYKRLAYAGWAIGGWGPAMAVGAILTFGRRDQAAAQGVGRI